jgi:hypothetical protein
VIDATTREARVVGTGRVPNRASARDPEGADADAAAAFLIRGDPAGRDDSALDHPDVDEPSCAIATDRVPMARRSRSPSSLEQTLCFSLDQEGRGIRDEALPIGEPPRFRLTELRPRCDAHDSQSSRIVS